jgi:acetolactate synthase-1/2/3 large subunit
VPALGLSLSAGPWSRGAGRVPIGSARRAAPASVSPPAAPSDIIEAVADRIARCPFFLWIGFGARHAGPALRELVDLTGAPVVASPRAKGIFPEDDPAYAGVSGLGGHERVRRILRDLRPAHALVLGTRLGEFTSFWRDELLPSEELIHVDVDPTVFGRAYPHARTLGVHAEVHDFVRRLVARLTAMHSPRRRPSAMVSAPTRAARAAPHDGPIRTSFLFDEVQRIVVDQSRALVLAEPGGAFAWGTRRLVFREPSRWRTTMAWASMGHTAAGVVGAALANGRKAVCLVGDGALLMNNEIHTAVRYRAPAVWVVLNNAEYGMVRHAMTAQRMRPVETALGVVDFAAIARAVGASGERVEREGDIAAALGRALESEGPYLVDVVVDPEERGPYMDRVDSLIEQGVVGSDDV